MVENVSTEFGLALYPRLAAQEGNLFFSPFSLFSALTTVMEGAGGETALEMGRGLGLPATLHEAAGARRPWRTETLLQDLARLQEALCARDPAEISRLKNEIETLRDELSGVQAALQQAQEKDDWKALSAHGTREGEIVARLNRNLETVEAYELHIASALWAEKTYPFREDFLRRMAAGPGDLFAADFKNDFEAERLRINRWTAAHTADRIQGLIGPLMPEQARLMTLIVVNAIYFKGDWLVPFPAEGTTERPFTAADDRTVDVAMMRADDYVAARYAAFHPDGSFFDTPFEIRRGQTAGLYPDRDGFAMLELPYKGDRLAMIVIAPKAPGGLARIESRLTPDHLEAWIAALRPRSVHIRLPRFKLETDYTLKPILQELGIVRAFRNPLEPRGADFKAMSASDDPRLQLYITQVLHKAFVEVNERGTEAAAATAVLMALAAGIENEETIPFTPSFEADRPFLFLIRDRVSGSLLFIGRVTEP